MLERWAFRDLMSIQSELNRLFGRTYRGNELESGVAGSWVPPLDVYESGDKFVLAVELPGIDPTDVEVSVEDSFDKGVLKIEVAKREEAKPKKILVKATG